MNYFNYLSAVLHTIDSRDSKTINEADYAENPTAQEEPEAVEAPVGAPEVDEEPMMSTEEDPNYSDELDDASYMDTSMEQPAQTSISDVMTQQQSVKLFEDFENLNSLIGYVHENLTSRISCDMLDKKQLDVLQIITDKLENVKTKIKDYLMNSYLLRSYEENLYTYMLLRSEFLTSVVYLKKKLLTNNNEKNN